VDHPAPLTLFAAPEAGSTQQLSNLMTSAFQDAILGHIAAADPAPADALDVFFKVCMYEDVTLPQYADALKELKDLGLIVLAVHDVTNRLIRLTEKGRRYVNELIDDALLAMRANGKIAEA
jgi:hypothetical protein